MPQQDGDGHDDQWGHALATVNAMRSSLGGKSSDMVKLLYEISPSLCRDAQVAQTTQLNHTHRKPEYETWLWRKTRRQATSLVRIRLSR
jgi:hypothetical protein